MRFGSIAVAVLLSVPVVALAAAQGAAPSPPQPAAQPAPQAPPQLTAEECAVWQRELSFAHSVASHDATAFAGHVSENAAFGASTREPHRGRTAIVPRWMPIIEGKRVALRWYPTRVTMAAGVNDTAWSSGPTLFEALDPNAKQRYHIGAFHSVWHKDADGVWRVLFDDGVDPKPATAEEAAAFEAGRAQCRPSANPNRS